MVPVVVRAADSRLVLWGMPLLWWGRLGKVLEFTAGLVVVLDLVGPEPLRALGRRFSRLTWSSADETFSRATNLLGLIAGVSLIGYLYALAASYVHADLFPGISGRSLGVLVSIAVTVVVFLALAVLLGKLSDGQLGMATVLAPLVVPAMLLSILIGAVVLLPWLAFIHLFVVPTCKALAWLLNQDRPAHVLRWVAFVLFIVGFHFDLLAS